MAELRYSDYYGNMSYKDFLKLQAGTGTETISHLSTDTEEDIAA